jgi:hypothetical protein
VNEGLPVGTRVQKGRGARTRTGVVMHHEPEHSHGSFPVRFDDGIWEMLDASYVTVLEPPGAAIGEHVAQLTPGDKFEIEFRSSDSP